MLDYTDQLRDHFFNPRNAGVLEAANAVGEAGSLAEGNAIRLMLRIDAATRIVEAARFQAFGGPAIAACSVLTELVEGRSVEAAQRLTGADIDAALGGAGRAAALRRSWAAGVAGGAGAVSRRRSAGAEAGGAGSRGEDPRAEA
ncbi:iron-sulfur cluster assembly scaffold protein [Cereibacter changlensis]|uniref:iron-sulfur cluster assembly scaffold protein n=1 Tax=Cereibacter changlensis TaxID=402884 RepID=UPI00200AB85D|nr:iron-sulfur cluster assembly scaffold protein [Cereibacter changlensis]